LLRFASATHSGGTELLVGGISFIALKYGVHVLSHVTVRLVGSREAEEEVE